MKLSTQWLADTLDLADLTPQQIADTLTATGLEVEGGIEESGVKFKGVILAQCVALDSHPNAEKLRLATIDQGEGRGRTQVVCGAANLAVGQRIAFATDGATVFSPKSKDWFTLGKACIRGVDSCGMVCSVGELALAEAYPPSEDGIWVLNDLLPSTPLGTPLEVALGLDANSDAILETAPTANRGDWMSVLGTARELAAVLKRPIRSPEVLPLEAFAAARKAASRFEIALTDASICTRYYGASLSGIQVAPSPEWLKRRLEACGIRSINTVVDITNYVLLEFGQPLHAFDADRLAAQGSRIGVRAAQAGEPLACLDEQTYTLTPTAVCITAGEAPVALAGVMGGSDTAVHDGTTSIFLEAAFFPSLSTRKSARSVGIRTESSARFERGVDEGGVETALRRAIHLYQTLCGATLEAVATAEAAPLPEALTLEFPLAKIETLTGLAVDADTVEGILTGLGFGVDWLIDEHHPARQTALVSVPTFRQKDVALVEDLVEEVIRIHGYDAIPSTLPTLNTPVTVAPRRRFMARLHQCLLGLGFNEWMTNSLHGPDLLDAMHCPDNAAQRVELSNTHSQDHVWMRQSLLPSLLNVVQYNVANGSQTLWGYELGRAYFKRGKASHKQTGVQEKLLLGGAMLGTPQTLHWLGKQSVDFYTLKGKLEALFAGLELSDAVAFEAPASGEAPDQLHPGRTAMIRLGGKPLGVLGQVHPRLEADLKLKQPCFLFELDADALLKELEKRQKASLSSLPTPLQRNTFPAMTRDLALLVSDAVSHQTLTRAMDAYLAKEAPAMLQAITLFDCYQGEGIAAGHRSLAYRLTYQSKQSTLTDATVDGWQMGLRSHLEASLSVGLR